MMSDPEIRVASQASQWPSKQQLLRIAKTTVELSAMFRRQRRAFSRQNIETVHTAIEKLDYLFHGRTLDDYRSDRELWKAGDWPFSLARWVVATPGPLDCLPPGLVSACSENTGPRLPIPGDDIVGWDNDVTACYRSIFAALSVVKCYFGHEPVFSINKWMYGRLADHVPRIAGSPCDEDVLGRLVPEGASRTIVWGELLDSEDRAKYPAEIQKLGKWNEAHGSPTTVPEQWLDSLDEHSEELRGAISEPAGKQQRRDAIQPEWMEYIDELRSKDPPTPWSQIPRHMKTKFNIEKTNATWRTAYSRWTRD